MAARVLAFYTLCILLCSLHGVVTAATANKKLHLTIYTHEIPLGPNATLLIAAGTGQYNKSDSGWGSFIVFDNIVRAGNNTGSRLLGSVTGTTVITSIGGTFATGRGSQITLQFLFKEGSKFNGSSLIVTGHILAPAPPANYELIVLGGTGALRGYSGYAIMTPVPGAPVSSEYSVFHWDFHVTHKE